LAACAAVSRAAETMRAGEVSACAFAGEAALSCACGNCAAARIALTWRCVAFAPGTQRPVEVSCPAASAWA
jgi:hypothetical protein